MWGWLNSTERFAIELFVELRERKREDTGWSVQCSTVQWGAGIEEEVR
jgi:hypothetical protein